jgi:hypothetical protein
MVDDVDPHVTHPSRSAAPDRWRGKFFAISARKRRWADLDRNVTRERTTEMFHQLHRLTAVQRRLAVGLASALAVTATVGGVALSSTDAPAGGPEPVAIATAGDEPTAGRESVATAGTAPTSPSTTTASTTSTAATTTADAASAGALVDQRNGVVADHATSISQDTTDTGPETLPTTPPSIVDGQPIQPAQPASAESGSEPSAEDADDAAADDDEVEPDDALEATPGPDAGSVITIDGTTTPPVRTPAPSSELALLDETAPPSPSTPLQLQGAPGGLTSNAFGCQSNCLTHALLTPSNEGPFAYLDVETKVSTVGSLWVLDEPTFTISGVPVVPAQPTVTSGNATTSWTTAIQLDYGQEYHMVLKVEDTQHNAKWAMGTWTLPEPGSCYSQCITMAKVEHTDDHGRVDLVVTTSAPAAEDIDFQVAVSSQAPGVMGAYPILPADEPFVVDQDGANDIRGHVAGLEADTDYHVLVRATDQEGFTSYALGQFTTGAEDPTDVKIGFERIYVHHDGDAGAWGQGELSFAWGRQQDGLTPTVFGARSEDKIGDGTSVSLGDANYWVSVYEGGTISLEVDAHENDTHGNVSYDHCWKIRRMLFGHQNYDETCMTRTNIALSGPMTLADIAALPTCDYYGLNGDEADDRCLKLQSMAANDKHALFDAIVSFRIEN